MVPYSLGSKLKREAGDERGILIRAINAEGHPMGGQGGEGKKEVYANYAMHKNDHTSVSHLNCPHLPEQH